MRVIMARNAVLSLLSTPLLLLVPSWGWAHSLAPNMDALANAVYQGIRPTDLTLSQGQWQAPGPEPSEQAGLVTSLHYVTDLDEDGQEEAAVLLWYKSGGSGTQLYLAVMEQAGQGYRNRATTLLGDRVQVVDGRVTAGQLTLTLVEAGEDDPACCPSHLVDKIFRLRENQLTAETVSQGTRLSPAILAGTTWKMRALRRDEPLAESLTITLSYQEGRLVGSSGCNRYFAQVASGGRPGTLRIGPIGGTRRFCPGPEGDYEMAFLHALARVDRLRFQGGRLILDWQDKEDQAQMTFIRMPN
jgi:heat shock protein HslJ